MNYRHHYNQLILRAKNRTLHGYTETHHIIPKCLNGSDDASNLVELTPEEHYVAHQLLSRMYPGNIKLVFAMNMMCVGQERNNKKYGWIRRNLSLALSKIHSGKKLSEQHIESISKANTGNGNYWFGKSWEDIYGIEKASQLKLEMSKRMSIVNLGENNPMFGISWEEKYGKEEAEKRKQKLSEKRKGISPLNKNKTLEDYIGIDRAQTTKDLMSRAKKEKSWEEIFGEDNAKIRRENLISRIEGKSWEDIHGKEKALAMKKKMQEPKTEETKKKMSDARKLYWQKKKNPN